MDKSKYTIKHSTLRLDEVRNDAPLWVMFHRLNRDASA